jgi:hypothetical protein
VGEVVLVGLHFFFSMMLEKEILALLNRDNWP